jgi:hypothetical protein
MPSGGYWDRVKAGQVRSRACFGEGRSAWAVCCSVCVKKKTGRQADRRLQVIVGFRIGKVRVVRE